MIRSAGQKKSARRDQVADLLDLSFDLKTFTDLSKTWSQTRSPTR